MSDPKHEYPSAYGPGADPLLDEIWEMLDKIKPGVIPTDVRAFIAGMWRGHLAKKMAETRQEYPRV